MQALFRAIQGDGPTWHVVQPDRRACEVGRRLEASFRGPDEVVAGDREEVVAAVKDDAAELCEDCFGGIVATER